ncbi:MAG TPA: SIMPL domain-containing protein [Paenalcaligenes sp.]|nr:SIMPL domain-containing protein [Paenalcaligenes sp.]
MTRSAYLSRGIASPAYILMGLLAAVGLLIAQPALATEEEQNAKLKPPVVNIQAEARTEVAQDTVQFVLFVQKEGKEQVEVTKEVNKVLAQALEQAKQAAEDEDIDISTGAFSVSPRYNDKGKISTWQARAELVLQSKQIDEAAEIAGDLSDLLSISRIDFSLSDQVRTAQEDELTEIAIRAFEDRAQLMAESLGYDYYLLKELTLDSSATVYSSRSQAPQGAVLMSAAPEQEKLAVAAGQEEVSVTARGAIHLLDKTDTCQ